MLENEAAHICQECGGQIFAGRADAAYCSNACRQRSYRHRSAAELAAMDDARDPAAERRLQEAEFINGFSLALKDLEQYDVAGLLSPKGRAILIDRLKRTTESLEDPSAGIRNAGTNVTDNA